MDYKSEESYAQFLAESKRWSTPSAFNLYRQIARPIRFNDKNWFGTRVEVGDIGALPYANVVVQCDGYYGCIVEGRPSLIEPKRTAYQGDEDEGTVEHGRIMDLGSAHCFLNKLNGKMSRETCIHSDFLGLIAQGKKYFAHDYRLDF